MPTFASPPKIARKLPQFSYFKVGSLEAYQRLTTVNRELNLLMQDLEAAILTDEQNQEHFHLNGYCHVCDCRSYFKMNNPHHQRNSGAKVATPNWREGLQCVGCNLNNRKRGALHIFERECSPNQESQIYLTEQKSPLYRHVAQKFDFVVGSEYLETKIPLGTLTTDGIRNESLTCLSFADNKFDQILSLDVLEHVPNYLQAFKECYRVLKANGKLVLSVPFSLNSPNNTIRAKIDSLGNITHLKKPQYHGDPMSKDGVLCFQDFGWQMLDELREVGFKHVEAVFYRSRFYGYLGSNHIIFVAQK